MMSVVLAHLTGRLRELTTRPASIAVLLLAVIISAFFWPSLTPTGTTPWGIELGSDGRADTMRAASAVMIGVLWIAFFPLLIGMSVRPVTTGRSRSSSINLGHPALPISPRTRIVTEVAASMALIGVLRIPLVIFRNHLVGGAEFYPSNIAGPFFLGALVLLPALILVLGRTNNLEHLFLGTVIIGTLITASMPLGLMSTPSRVTATTGVLIAIAIWFAGRPPISIRIPALFGTKRLSRPAMSPVARLRLDFVLRPLPTIVPFVLGELLLMFLLARGVIGGTTMYFGSTLVFSLLIGFLVLRPMGSAQAIAGMWGKASYEPGDFAKAFSVLPVPRALVLRTVYLHGIITGCLLWLGIVLVGAFNAKVALGEALFFTASDGKLIAEFVFPMLALIPCAAGFLVEGAVGDKKMAFFSGALLFIAPHVAMLMLFGGAGPAGMTVAMIVIAIAGGLPALRHFNLDFETA